jgi:tRNA (Thr-GGU) A37 N-methylase
MRQSLPPPTEDVPLTVIGVVRSAHTEPENTPIQGPQRPAAAQAGAIPAPPPAAGNGDLRHPGPRRVNPIGLSLIQLREVTPEAVVFAGVDVIDGTPVIDLKPYVTRFDRPPGDPPCGWFDEVTLDEGSTPAGLTRPLPPA